jgi:hypothetical protein
MMDEKMGGMHTGGKMCGCMHHKIPALMITLIGATFLLGNIGVFTMGFVDGLWPLFLLVLGGTMLMGNKCKCCKMPQK